MSFFDFGVSGADRRKANEQQFRDALARSVYPPKPVMQPRLPYGCSASRSVNKIG
jgi:hypothetical protein